MNVKDYPTIHQAAGGNVSIHDVSDQGFLLMVMAGNVSVADYKKGFETLTQLMEEKGLKTLVMEASELRQSDPEARAWLMKKHIPDLLRRLGRLNLAMVSPKSIFQKMAVNLVVKTMKALGKPVDIKPCDELEEGFVWAREKALQTMEVSA